MGGTLAEFPGVYQLRIGGRTYQANTSFEPYRRDAFRHRSIASQRESINVAGKTGEGTVNSAGFWRWSALDWSYGSGQLYQDREGDIANRFYQSKGVYPFIQNNLSLLNDTQQVYTDSYKATAAQSIGPVVFIRGKQTVKYTTDWITFTTIASLTLTGSDMWTFMDHDNANVYVCSPTKGLWTIPVSDVTVGTPVNVITDRVDWVGAAGGRVLCSVGPSLYDVSSPPASGHLPSPLITQPELNWVWQTAVAVSSNIYVSGNCQESNVTVYNTFSAVYRTTLESDGTALQAPVVALTLPHNEYVNILFPYMNYVFIGTSLGVRMCRTVSAADPSGNTGDLISGPIIPNLLGPSYPLFVTGFCANGRYVWFTWQGNGAAGSPNNASYDGTSVGLGRMDIGTLIDELAPAYASDLMVTLIDEIFWLDWDPITNGPMLSVATSGIWVQDPANLVASGHLDSGFVTYNIPDDKIVAQALLSAINNGGTTTISLALDGGGFTAATPLATNQESNPPTLLTSGAYAPTDGVPGMFRGADITTRVILNRNGGDTDLGPTVSRVSLRSWPCVVSGVTVSAVLKLYSVIEENGIERPVNPYDDYLYLDNFRLGQVPIYYQEGTANGNTATPATGYTAVGVISEIDWLPHHMMDTPRYGFQADMVLYITTFVG